MAGLFEKFEDGVINELTRREKAFDVGRTSARSINAVNVQNQNSWVRLASSVDIKTPTTAETPAGREKEFEKRINQIKTRFGTGEGSEFARALVLTGGASKYNNTGDKNTITGRSGFDSSSGANNTGAYGLGGQKFGYKPMPGIQSLETSFKDSDGALIKANIKIKCFSPEQLDLLESLYCRVGYNILVEWGNTTWLTGGTKNDSTSITNIQNYFTNTSETAVVTSAFKEFFSTEPSPKAILNRIKETRTKKAYNYDGFYGIVSKFSYTFNQDASYDITVEAYTMGTVVQGLTVGSFNNNTNPESETEEEADKDKKPANKLEQLLGLLEKAPTSDSDPNGWYKNSAIADQNKYIELFRLRDNISEMNSPYYKVFKTSRTGVDVIKVLWGKGEDEDGKEQRVFSHYMTFYGLLTLLDTHANIYRKKDTPILSFRGDNPMFSVPYHFSGDPTACIIPFQSILVPPTDGQTPGASKLQRMFSFSNFNAKYEAPEGSDPSFVTLVDNGFIKNLNKVFISFDLIKRSIRVNKDNTSRVTAIQFLQTLLDEVKTCLGGVNNFRVVVDEETLQVNIIDYGTLIGTREKGLFKFTTYGIGNGSSPRAGLLHSLNFTTTIPNDLAANVTIGAQANGNQVGENAVSFSEFNTGLVDRTVYKKATLPSGEPEDSEESWVTTLRNIKDSILNCYTLSGRSVGFAGLQDYKGYYEPDIERLKSLNADYIRWVVGYYSRVTSYIANPFIIPFDLTFTLDGIAGIKIFQTFEIDNRILPFMYRDKVRFVVFDVSHKLENNKWTTSIKGKTVPKLDNPKEYSTPPLYGTLDAVGDPEISQKLQDAYIARDSAQAPAGKTLVLQNPIGPIWFQKAVVKTQIYLHHTAGTGTPAGVVADWSSRKNKDGSQQHIATHYVIGRDGVYDLLFPLETGWAYHLGTNQKADPTGIGIELIAWGPVTKGYYINSKTKKKIVKDKNKYYSYTGTEVPASEVAQPRDRDGNIIKSFRGGQYFQEYTDQQIAKLEEILIQITKTYKNIPLVYDYDIWFPKAIGTSTAAFNEVNNLRTPGLYTHCSVRGDKADIVPTPKILALGKRLSEKQDPRNAILKQFNRGLEAMIKTLGYPSDDTASDYKRVSTAYTKIKTDGTKYIKTLTDGDLKKFKKMITEWFNGSYEALCLYIFGVADTITFSSNSLSKFAVAEENRTFITQYINSAWENGAEVQIKRRLKKLTKGATKNPTWPDIDF